MKILIHALCNPRKVLIYLFSLPFFRLISDQSYLKLMYFLRLGKTLNLNSPQSFNEKLQWLKINDRNPEYTNMVDKLNVRALVKERIGEEYLIPLLCECKTYNEIDFDKLPNQFVLKPNHTSGNVYICKDKSKIDHQTFEKKVKKWMSREYFWLHREWPYKNIQPRILIESYMKDDKADVLLDYKIYCFNGIPKFIQVISDRNTKGYYVNHFDFDWNEMNIERKKYQKNPNFIEKPNHLEKMYTIATKLSVNIPFSRIDLYVINGRIYFGEITFFPVSGYVDFSDETDEKLGRWISIK